MRIALILALLLASPASFGEIPKDLPKRKPGLWDMKTSLAEMGGIPQNIQMCVGENTDDILAQPGENRSGCKEPSIQRDGARISFAVECRVQGSTAMTMGTLTGDFTNSYQADIRTRYTPPLQGMASTTVKQDARWVGPCKAGQKPGDVFVQGIPGLPGVGNFNIQDMMKNLPRR